MLHRPELKVNSTWNDIFLSKEPFLFSAGDPQALVVLALYVSAGGKLVYEQGVPTLEEVPLTQTLTLIKNGVTTKTFSPTLLNFESDDQSLQAYHNGSGGMVITWAPGDEAIYPIADLGTPTTFANGWMWALSGSSPENQQLAVNLAEFLLEDSFLAEWISGMNYLPTRIYQGAHTNTILESAHALPANDVLTVLGPILNQALSRVLNGDQVEVVVRSVMDQVK
jgi:ABC-type glycerol-3-phosphate transport system substrate-binding protein